MNTARWTTEIDEIMQAFKREFGHLSPLALNWKPDAKTWSIAQNIDHLMVINGTYFSMIKDLREGRIKTSLFGQSRFLVKFFSKAILKAVQPDRKKKMKTFPMWEPSQSEISGDIIKQFEQHQKTLKDFIESCTDLLQAETVINSPASRVVVYKLETAFDIICTHERRHLAQALEVKVVLPINYKRVR